MILLGLLLQLFAGTAHPVTIDWNPVAVTDTNDDGSTFTRAPLGYWVYRAQVVNGTVGAFTLLNPDSAVLGMTEDDGTFDPLEYVDEFALQGLTYVYQITALDFGGESAASGQSSPQLIPVNPDAPPHVDVVIE